ncbi:hypothetical protein [Paenibacillus planticolens]|uniref:Uncharacterized protein n=1 Tax=Paenibacillus planticolens TaxID=2654976 RepID=A0ABX1ZNE0_9BACL|nr:hypothetical protein [Paenibacillus planticolens]NOV01331.1 hypothetical protein [Paenibacillus planticolens]
MPQIIQSSNPDIDTLKCPKCKAIWRAEGEHAWGDDRWSYKLGEDKCPSGCITFFGFRVTGKLVKKPNVS